jgi:hypothetical protein
MLIPQPAVLPFLLSAAADMIFRATIYDRSGSTLGVFVDRAGAPHHLAVSAEGAWTLSLKAPAAAVLLYESAANVLRGGDLNADGSIAYQGDTYVLEACLDGQPRTARVRGR